MSGFLDGVDGRMIAELDQGFASINGAIDAVIAKIAPVAKQRDAKPEEIFVRLILVCPEMEQPANHAWLAAALTKLVLAHNDSEERAA